MGHVIRKEAKQKRLVRPGEREEREGGGREERERVGGGERGERLGSLMGMKKCV